MRVFRTTLLLVALTLLLMFVGQALGRRRGMTMGLGFAVIMNAFAYFFSDKIAGDDRIRARTARNNLSPTRRRASRCPAACSSRPTARSAEIC